ncbi:hypothetical protein TUM4445_23290 [Shewanella sp. MBTL60-112-B2]|nr:hypothetical protein TUM4444_35860 [Shewanella sp. MBTL60-112-B1]GIU34539.1 hypothetical protein TUM4445_23290 [Shewanella sp. MBTL60-112-B2]
MRANAQIIAAMTNLGRGSLGICRSMLCQSKLDKRELNRQWDTGLVFNLFKHEA